MLSSNGATVDGVTYAKHGDILTLTFTVNVALASDPSVTIAGQGVTAEKGDGNDYTAAYTVVSADVAALDGTLAVYDIGTMTAVGNATNRFDPVADTSAIQIDVTAPTVRTFVTPDANGVIGAQQTHTIIFSEAVTGLADTHFSTSTGVIEISQSGSGTTYTVQFTPDAASFILTLAVNAVSDATGNTGPTADPVEDRQVSGSATAPASTDANLSALTIADNTGATVDLNQDFNAAVQMGYTADVANDVTSVTFMPTVNAAATVTVADETVARDATSDPITLTVGETAIDIVVTAEDISATPKTYTVTVTRASAAPSLALAVDTGSLPDDGITSNGQVEVTLASAVTAWKYTIKGTTTDVADPSVTTFTLDEGEYADGEVQVVQSVSGADSLATSLAAVTVDTTAPVITLTGGDITLPPGDEYAEQGASATDAIAEGEPADLTAEIVPLITFAGDAVETVDINTAGEYIITYDVSDLAGNAAEPKTRSVTVPNADKEGAISAITNAVAGAPQVGQELMAGAVTDPDSPDVDSPVTDIIWQWESVLAGDINYEDIMGATDSTYTPVVADIGKTIRVFADYTDGHGPNKSVTSAATVTRSSDADLPALTITDNDGMAVDLDPIFDADTDIYAASVLNGVTSVTLMPTTNHDRATVTVAGKAVARGGTSIVLRLTPGLSHFIPVKVTAENGTTKDYTVNLVRGASDATLRSLTIADNNNAVVTLDPIFDADTETYAASVLNGVTSVTFMPTTNDDGGTVTVADVAVARGDASEPIDLTAGVGVATNIAIVVTTGDGTATMKTYTVTVTRTANFEPRITGGSATPSVAENTPITIAVATYTATDVDGDDDAITWSLGGADKNLFTLAADDSNRGVLTLNAVPNFEDAHGSIYTITVTATDNGVPNESSTPLDVTVTVTNEDEDGTISVITGVVQAGQELTAGTITDPDSPDPAKPVTDITWQWQNADGTVITGTTNEKTYTPTATEVGKTIQVMVTYTDGQGPDKEITSAATIAVVAAGELATPDLALAMDTDFSQTDLITSNGVVNVVGLANGAMWRYSINSGTDFTPGTDIDPDTSVACFTLPPNRVYAAGTVQVVQTLAGTDSDPAMLGAVTVDKTAPVIDLNGVTAVTLTLGQSETNPPTVTDTFDNNVTVTADIDIAAANLGSHTVTYNAMDAAGNEATPMTRTVVVQSVLAFVVGKEPALTSDNAGDYAMTATPWN